MNQDFIALHYSDLHPLAVHEGFPSADKESEFSLLLRSREPDAALQEKLTALTMQPPHTRRYLTHQELEELSGASQEDADALQAYFASFGLHVQMDSLLQRTLRVKGKISALEKAFHVQARIFRGEGGVPFIAHEGPVHLPAAHHQRVRMVRAFSPAQRKESRIPLRNLTFTGGAGENTPMPGYLPQTVAQAYRFPGDDATGCIGIVELGGKYSPKDIKEFFTDNKLPVPKIVVEGTPPSNNNTPLNNVEVTTDLQVAGAAAPGAKLVIYYANTVQEAMLLAISDTAHKPSVISISWAGPEMSYTPVEQQEMSYVYASAAMLGITVLAASGDHGAYNQRPFLNVNLPASHPLVLGVGGTNLSIEDGSITREVVWNEALGGQQVGTGGGFSSLYPIPAFQQHIADVYPYAPGSSTRGVPDVAALASALQGYQLVFNGEPTVIGGTSLATPLWAALIARLNSQLGYSLGFCTPFLYALAGLPTFHQILEGNNGYWPAAAGWNPCTGLGSPDGENLLTAFKALEASHSPTSQTAQA